jgi:hypothetical protein
MKQATTASSGAFGNCATAREHSHGATKISVVSFLSALAARVITGQHVAGAVRFLFRWSVECGAFELLDAKTQRRIGLVPDLAGLRGRSNSRTATATALTQK